MTLWCLRAWDLNATGAGTIPEHILTSYNMNTHEERMWGEMSC